MSSVEESTNPRSARIGNATTQAKTRLGVVPSENIKEKQVRN